MFCLFFATPLHCSACPRFCSASAALTESTSSCGTAGERSFTASRVGRKPGSRASRSANSTRQSCSRLQSLIKLANIGNVRQTKSAASKITEKDIHADAFERHKSRVALDRRTTVEHDWLCHDLAALTSRPDSSSRWPLVSSTSCRTATNRYTTSSSMDTVHW